MKVTYFQKTFSKLDIANAYNLNMKHILLTIWIVGLSDIFLTKSQEKSIYNRESTVK